MAISVERRRQIIELGKAGLSRNRIAAKLHADPLIVSNVLRESGLLKPVPPQFAKKKPQSSDNATQSNGPHKNAFNNLLRAKWHQIQNGAAPSAASASIAPNNQPRLILSQADRVALGRKLYADGTTMPNIFRQIGCSGHTLYSWLRPEDVHARVRLGKPIGRLGRLIANRQPTTALVPVNGHSRLASLLDELEANTITITRRPNGEIEIVARLVK